MPSTPVLKVGDLVIGRTRPGSKEPWTLRLTLRNRPADEVGRFRTWMDAHQYAIAEFGTNTTGEFADRDGHRTGYPYMPGTIRRTFVVQAGEYRRVR